jgi:hypothetical protein
VLVNTASNTNAISAGQRYLSLLLPSIKTLSSGQVIKEQGALATRLPAFSF